MKFVAAVLVLLLAGSVALADKTKNPGMRTHEGRSRHNAEFKSSNGEAVAAARKKNSSAASQLAQIERQGNRPRSAHTSAHASAKLTNVNAGQGKNKRIHFTHKTSRAGGKKH